MLRWQRNHLTTYRGKLVEGIICNELVFSHLISVRVLAKVDVERIKRTPDRYEQTAVLLDIVETRENGYVAMAKALARVDQTGPLAVFMDGFARHVIPQVKVDFLGKTLRLTDVFDESEMTEIIDEIKTNLSFEEYVKVYDESQNAHPMKLLCYNIPEKTPLYVPRSLSRRLKVNSKLFKVNCSDVFVFKGLDWSQLTKLVEPQRVAFSSTQLLSLSTRFIILEHVDDWEEICKFARVPVHLIKYEKKDEYKRIEGNSDEEDEDNSDEEDEDNSDEEDEDNSDEEAEDDTVEVDEEHDVQVYVLETTTGGSKIIHQFLKHHHDSNSHDASISEKQFLERLTNENDGSSGVCICDRPGMGKSLLLANLARKMKLQKSDKLVVFIQLQHFFSSMVEDKWKHVKLTLDVPLAKKILFQYLTPSYLEYFLLTKLLNKREIQLELFFDGFDEVQQEQVQITKQLLSILSGLPNTRTFVTSRLNMRHELEASLRVVSYDILPFSHANQIDFLTTFWSNMKPTNSEGKLREFAEFCIGELKRKLNEDEHEITGIPLQCRLVGDVFSRAANIFAQPGRNAGVEELCKIESSMSDLYKRYCDMRFSEIVARVSLADTSKSILLCAAEQAKIILEVVVGESHCLSEMQKMKNFHMLQALKLLFPWKCELFSQLLEEAHDTTQVQRALSLGILQRHFTDSYESLEFMHRTFAEYFVAEFFSSLLYTEASKLTLLQHLIQFLLCEVMKTNDIKLSLDPVSFKLPVVMYFFNSACAEKRINSQDKLLLTIFASSITGDHLWRILKALICQNHINLLLLLKQILLKLNSSCLKSYKHTLVSGGRYNMVSQLAKMAAKYSSVFFVEKLFDIFQECFQIDLGGRDKHMLAPICDTDCRRCYRASKLCDGLGLYVYSIIELCSSPLGIAVKYSIKMRLPDYDKIHFFAKYTPMEKGNSLKPIVQFSDCNNPMEIENLLNILNWLLDKYKNLLIQEPLVLVHSRKVHVDVVKLFLQKGVDPMALDKGLTLVHNASMNKNGEDFCQLCRLLIQDFNAVDLFKEVKGKWSSPLPRILANSNIPDEIIQMIYDLPWLDAYEAGKTLEASSQTSYMRIGMDINYSDEKDLSLLLGAAKGARSLASIRRMIDMGANVIAQDGEGNTFVHYIVGYWFTEDDDEIVQLLIDKEINKIVHVANNEGRTPLHDAVGNLEPLPKTLDLLVSWSHSQNAQQQDNSTCNRYVDLNAVDMNGESVLYGAVRGNKSLALVKYLVGNGADWTIKNRWKDNLAHMSAYEGLFEHLKYFVELGCNINEVNADGNNVLQVSVRKRYFIQKALPGIVQFLVDRGAQKENKNKRGETAYMIAVRKELRGERILKLLK